MKSLENVLAGLFGPNALKDVCNYPATVPSYYVPREWFIEAAREMKKAGARLVAEWATDETNMSQRFTNNKHTPPPLQWEGKVYPERSRRSGDGVSQDGTKSINCFGIYACYSVDSEYIIVGCLIPADDPTFPSLTKEFVPASRFERQMRSLMGVIPVGHPDPRPWIKHEDWPEEAYPLRKGFDTSVPMPRVKGEYEWVRAEGEGVHEIAVGPVHAGIIEPGHFRFQAVGEDILHLEERLGYVHKGIEKRFESISWLDGAKLAGRVSGDTTVAHALAYCRALEAMTGFATPERALWIRALMLERERIANHLGDIGAICNDVAFSFLLYQFSILRETMLRTNDKLFGHRFMMDRVIPGGVAADITKNENDEIVREIDWIKGEFERLVIIYDENSSLEDRVREAGILRTDDAGKIGVVGFVARASGIGLDCRIQAPFPPYDRIIPRMTVLRSGDIHARVWVRIEEIRDSLRIICEILEGLPEGKTSGGFDPPSKECSGFAVVEGWRGEIVYWIRSGHKGEINRCMVRDPSSVNWLALELAIHDNIVPDFPVCNKSFNQSYAGNDL